MPHPDRTSAANDIGAESSGRPTRNSVEARPEREPLLSGVRRRDGGGTRVTGNGPSRRWRLAWRNHIKDQRLE